MKKRALRLAATMIGAFLLSVVPATVSASAGDYPYYGFGTVNGRTDTVNINDYHSNSWDRFTHNYQFNSGGNLSYELGSPTTYSGHVQLDIYSANIRRDKNMAYVPPSYGVFSGNVATYPTNDLFERPTNPAYWTVYPRVDPNVIAVYDTLLIGVNSPTLGNSMNMNSVGQPGALQNTSIGGHDVVPIGANNATGGYIRQGDGWLYQSGSGSSTVTTPSQGGFLLPTSIK